MNNGDRMGMNILKKKEFQPNCRTREDGFIECNPVIIEGNVRKEATLILEPTSDGNYVAHKIEGSAEVIIELEKFLKGRIIKPK